MLNVAASKPLRKAGLAFLMLCAMAMPLQQAAAVDNTQDVAEAASADVRQNKQLVIKGLQAAKQQRWTESRKLMTQAQDEAGEALGDWLFYSGTKTPVDFDRISDFIRDHQDWPRQGTLKTLAEKSMPPSLSNGEVILWFNDFPPQTTDGMKRYLRALVDERQITKAKEKLNEWWPKASLDSNEQAYFLRSYGNMLDKSTQIARFNNTLFIKQYTNARALAAVIGQGYPVLAEARIGLASGKPGVDGLVRAVPAHLQDDPGFMLERLRWRRRNDMDVGAIEILHNMPPAAQIPNLGDWWKERNIMARRLIDKKDYKSAYLVVSKHGMTEGADFAAAEFMAGWLALRFNKQADKAFSHFEALYNGTQTPISRSRGAYWAGKASAALGREDLARQWFQVAARYQTAFYGQMAIGELKAEDRPPQQIPPQRTMGAEARFYNKSIVKAARYLHQAGYWKETTEFLDAMARDINDPEEYVLIGDLAQSLEHYHNAVRIGKKGLEKNVMMVDHAFPLILPRMRNVTQEWALIHGLIRQESQFDPQAMSPVGARGLMQLMPATAREVARKKGLAHQTDWLITRPDHNIALGSTYIDQLVDRYDGSYPLALAAYNGGMGNVDKWLKRFGDPRKGEIEMIDWIEMIPFDETRNYVQRVMESTYIYRLKLKAVQKSAQSPLHVRLE